MENPDFVDQTHPLYAFLISRRSELARQGAVIAGWRQHRGRQLGPYYRLTWRDPAGRQRSRYLGADRTLAQQVEGWLRSLRAERDTQRQLDRVRRSLRSALARQRTLQRTELAKLGLIGKGAEVRGWRRLRQSLDLRSLVAERSGETKPNSNP